MQCAPSFILVLDNILTSCSKHHRDHIKNQICAGQGHSHLTKRKALALMFWKLSFMTSLWPCLWSTTLACPQWTPPLPFFFPPPLFLTHTRTAQGKNDLSAALNSLHFYSPEWTSSTKGDIIFSGFDWPPPGHKMTSCPPPQTHHKQHQNTTNPPLHDLGCWVATATEQGQAVAELGSILWLGCLHNELGQRCSCVCGKQF